MPGFLISNYKKVQTLFNYDDSRCIKGELCHHPWNIQWNVLNKFFNDKCFYENDSIILVLDGIILNKEYLLKQYDNDNWVSFLSDLAVAKEDFFSEFKGAFSGAVYYKTEKKWIFFSDQIGNHGLFYYKNGEKLAIASQLNYISDWMRENDFTRKIENKWIDDFFSYGYMLDNHVILEDAKRLFPGHYLIYNESNNELIEKKYYEVHKTNINRTEDECIEQLDVLFTSAVKDVLKKCREYGYKAVLDISGGLDSRMIVAHVNKLGMNDQVIGINYAQDGSQDHIIAMNLAKKLNIKTIHYPLNSGEAILSIDDQVLMNNGVSYYFGITGGRTLLESLDKEIYGTELWGILGDIYEGAMITDDTVQIQKWNYERFRTSSLIPIISKGPYREYQDNELMWFYIRGMLAGQSTAYIRQNFLEAPAVFGDIDFMNYCFSIPYEKRTKDSLYQKWMIKKYPDISKIPYSATGSRVTASKKKERLCSIPFRIRKRILKTFFKKRYERISSMNPFDYWLKSNNTLLNEMNTYYSQNLRYLEEYPEIRDMVNMFYKSEKAVDKLIALNVISCIRQFII